MSRRSRVLLVSWVCLAAWCAVSVADDPPAAPSRPQYPAAPRGEHVDTYHGVDVPDPYRWLEDADSWATRGWIEAQNTLTASWLGNIAQRDAIEKRLTALWNYEKFGMPFREGGRYFYTVNSGLQNQSVLMTVDSLGGEPRVLIDPNTFSEDGTKSLGGTAVSPDGKLIAYGISDGGSDWRTWHVRDVATGKELADLIEWSKFSRPSWLPDSSGFFYNRYAKPEDGKVMQGVNQAPQTMLHRIGTPQSDDTLIYEDPQNPEWSSGVWPTDDGRYLLLSIWNREKRAGNLLYRPIDSDGPFIELIGGFTADWSFIDNVGTTFFVSTNLTPRGSVLTFDIATPAERTTIIPEATETLDGVNMVGGKLFASYLKDAHSVVRVFNLDGTPAGDGEVKLPGIGSASGFRGKRLETETFYSFSGYTTPGSIYRYDTTTGASTLFRQPKLDFDADRYETKQVFVESADGTRVPMFITHRKGVQLDGTNPTLLYGYGGFNVSLTPYFSLSTLVWMEMGGVSAVATLRGGGEYGEDWHLAGTKLHKQNVFDDFIACAEWLIDHKVTSRKRLAIQGGSNGGLLVGACMTQRPELFGACLPAVGVMDMLRYHRFTIGWAWASDYGTADESEEMFRYLYSYSPLHNCHPDRYPPTLITTADRDDRVVPAHSFKFAAALQHAQMGSAPILIRIETRAGHGGGTPTSKRIEQAVDVLAFLAKVFDMQVSDGTGGPDHHDD
ncbi:MAG: prolyl oligopeptidase family protein [Planctomycetota bacterium]